MNTFLRVIVTPLIAVLISVAIGMALLWVTGYPALPTLEMLIRQSFQDWYGFGQMLRTTTLLIFSGLAVAIGFKTGLFNIGVEGQLYMGAMALGAAGFYVREWPRETVQAIPWIAWMFGAIILSMLAGGLWAIIPGLLKAFTGAHEVITTIMMNFIALAWINYLVRPEKGSFAVPATLHTPSVPQHVRMPRLSNLFEVFQGSTVNYTLFIALAAAVLVWILLRFSKSGFELRAVGQNPVAARLAGISPRKTIIFSMFLSGAIAGLVGVDFVLGYKGYFEEGFSAGIGFVGIAVALLANNNPIGIIFTAFLFAVLNYGKVAAGGEVPKDIIEVIQATIIFAVVITNRLLSRAMIRFEARQAGNRAGSTPAHSVAEKSS
jgi:simple sugar transport system permease protein